MWILGLNVLIGSLSSDDFERRTSTGSEVFSLLTCLDDIKFVFLSFFTVIEAIWLKICAKPPSKNEKRPLPVDVRRSKTLLLKLPNVPWKLSTNVERSRTAPEKFPKEDILILVFNSTANVGAVKTQRRHLTEMEALIVVSWSSITRTTKNVTTVETNCAQELNFQIMSTELFMQVCCFIFNNFNFQSFLDSTYW